MSDRSATPVGKKRAHKPVEVAPEAVPDSPSPPVVEAPAQPAGGESPKRRAPREVEAISVPDEVLGRVEALLFSVDKALGWARVAAAVGLIDAETASEAAAKDDDAESGQIGKGENAKRAAGPAAVIREAANRLNAVYEQSGRAFRIEQVAGGYRVMTLAKHAPVLERFHGGRERSALSKAALETLAIIAYKQPLTRAGLEAIRGVACGEILRALLERRLVTIVGRAEELGRPILYGTSKRFLETFGLGSLKDLPTVEELRMRSRGEGTPERGSAEPDPTEAE